MMRYTMSIPSGKGAALDIGATNEGQAKNAIAAKETVKAFAKCKAITRDNRRRHIHQDPLTLSGSVNSDGSRLAGSWGSGGWGTVLGR